MQNKIKVLILHNYMTPYRFPLFREISKNQNIDLTVYFMSHSAKNRRWQKLPETGFKYRVLPKIELSYFGRDFLAYIINYTFPFEFFKNKFDIVISCGWLDFASQAAFLLCKLTGRKFIIWSESTVNEKSWRRTLTLPYVKFLVRNSDSCIAIGSLSKEYLISLGANPEKIFIAYSTVDVDYFRRASKISGIEKNKIRNEIGIKTSKVALFVGQFIERKGIIYLVKAFEKLKKKFDDASLVLLGYGPLANFLRSYVQDKKINDVFFVGHKEVSEMPKMYAIADVFVLPSLEETWGLVINEAMACGLPVITTNKVGSSIDLIENKVNGFICRSGSDKDLFYFLNVLFRNTKLRNKMKNNSIKKIENFTPYKAASNFILAIKNSSLSGMK